MCGITGILNFVRPIDPDELTRFTAALSHRGPDGQGTFVDGATGLGHTRLAILDLSESGRCPMSYSGLDGKRYWITFNGEIYNFLELRAELQKLGHAFKSDTDTEVIVAAYAQWGESCLPRFNGMWAFAIWDSEQKRLFLARDRFGIKPLYFSVSNRFAFASEMKAFLALCDFKPAVNQELVPAILSHSYSYEGKTDDTIMRGIKRLMPGSFLVVTNDGEVRVKRWWDTSANLPQIPQCYEEQIEKFKELFLDAVRIRLRSDVPIGTCLSGGIDSSCVATSIAWIQRNRKDLERCTTDWQRTFVATFPGTMLDERQYADQVIHAIGARPTYWTFDSNKALESLIDSIWSGEEVYGGITVPVWCLYRELRRAGVVVSLDGHGADELLGGYGWFLDWPMSEFNQNLYNDFHISTLPSILRNFDRASMAHGIEVRMPFMDWRLVTYAFALPAEAKVGGGFTKRVLRDAIKGILPESIRTRKQKLGFNAPMIEWFNGGMRPLIRSLVSHRLWQQNPYFDGKTLGTQVLARTEAAAWTKDDWDYALRTWTVMNFIMWQMLFVENDRMKLEGLVLDKSAAAQQRNKM